MSYRTKIALVLCILCGCSETSTQSSTYVESQKRNTETSPSTIYTITAGKGIGECQLGKDIQVAIELFGTPTQLSDGYFRFASSGIDLMYSEGAGIEGMIFYYRSPKHEVFSGTTSKGIGVDSSVDDVHRLYGSPSSSNETTISEFGALPGAKEKWMSFDHIGIAFTFWNEKLADIRLYRKQLNSQNI